MADDIVVTGIETNNLKKISIRLRKNAINLVVGASGSGKSSLTYDTISQIGIHELNSMYCDGIEEPGYKVESYSNMVVTVPIKQINLNNNVRSTIGTYFALNPCFAKVFSTILNLPYDFFVLNKTENVCPHCLGLGYIKQLDLVKLLDYDKTLEQVPIRCWNKNKDFYKKIIKAFCAEEEISPQKTFRQLTETEKRTFLYGQSKKKYQIKYKVTNHYSTRTTYYSGVMTGKPMLKNYSPSKDFFSEFLCEYCHGEKFDEKHKVERLCGHSIGEVMMLPFDQLIEWISTLRVEYDCSSIEFSLSQIESFSQKAVELNLGYLFLNRSIPSLSGGELQRLRLNKVFSTQLTDLLIVLDEPLSGLSPNERKIVYNNICCLSKKHTLLIVDHHLIFYDVAAVIIALGEGSGVNGGQLINAKAYLENQSCLNCIKPLPVKTLERIILKSKVYDYLGANIQIAINRTNFIYGASGVGKSTLLREYLIQYFRSYVYIDQKPLFGNSHSTVATDLGISEKIAKLFSTEFKLDKTEFSNMSGAAGACKTCNGSGIVSYGTKTQSQITFKCKDCRGTGYNKKLSRFKLKGNSVLDICEMTIDEAIPFFMYWDKSIYLKLIQAQNILLGHLILAQKTSSLSGGENLRIKLLKNIDEKKQVFGIDEPFKGLNTKEKEKIIDFFNSLVEKGKTVIVVDHEDDVFKFFTRKIELKNDHGILTE